MKIEIKIDKKINALIGYDFGYDVYLNQVKGKLKKNEENIIEFPNEIEKIAISFIQGFESGMIEEVGYEIYLKNILIIGSNKLVERFKKCKKG